MPAADRRVYFEGLADRWDQWRAKNRYYHHKVQELVAGAVPPGSDVLEIGTGTGTLLDGLRPRRGVGLNVSKRLSEIATVKYPHLELVTCNVDGIRLPDGFLPEYVVVVNMLDHVHDIWNVLDDLRRQVTERTLLLITTSNPLWAPVLRAGGRLGMRAPDSPRNYITNKDITGVLRLHDFDVVEQGHLLPVPKRLPVLGTLLNAVLPDLPVLRYASSVQYIAARPREGRPPLSCSVIIPCHNERDNIAECIARTPTMGSWTEIVVVDDGSRDGTAAQVEDNMATDPRLRLVAYDENHGKANAVRAGFAAARGDVVMILDADMAVAPEDLPKFLRPLQDGTADFVNGTRLLYPIGANAMPMANYLGNKAFCFVTSWALRQRVSDTLCGTKALLRRDYDRLPLRGTERWGDFDLLFGAGRAKLRIVEVPVHYGTRKAGESKMRVMRDGWLFLQACIGGWRSLRSPSFVPWGSRPPVAPGARHLG